VRPFSTIPEIVCCRVLFQRFGHQYSGGGSDGGVEREGERETGKEKETERERLRVGEYEPHAGVITSIL
jgi:hypothetical protein